MLYSAFMTRTAFTIFATLPAIVVPAAAQQENGGITATDYVSAQITILEAVTELLQIKGIADAPQEVAAGINQLAGYVHQLAAMKPTDSTAAAKMVEAELADKAHAAATSLQHALQTTADQNFYNSQELADAIQNFAQSFQVLK